MSHDSAEITRLLGRVTDGDRQAADELLPLLYSALHQMARGEMRRQRPDHTLGATALVHEAYLKLFQGQGGDFRDRDHFLALASRAMRQVLVDHARTRNREKRRPPGKCVPLDDLVESYETSAEDLVSLDDALRKLASVDPQMVKVVELRFFGGLPVKDVARILGLSVRTVEREWQAARGWLKKTLGEAD
ncbi:MAG: sigma-70 family RNA polymerase sigma factor [Planctomycetota bacterium]